MGEVLWRPTPAAVAASRAAAFRTFLRDRGLAQPGDWEALRTWSVAEAPAFWSALWDFAGVVGEKGEGPVLVDGDRMPGARWFPRARLNYAENLLQGDGAAEVLVFRGEDGATVRLDRAALCAEVGRVAAGLAADGVGPGVRVAGFLPNIPQAVIAMLATASLGAAWTSCSPDFGAQGVLDRFGQIGPQVLVTADGYHYGGRVHDIRPTVAGLQAVLPSLRRTVMVPFGDPGAALPAGVTAWDAYGRPGAAPVFAHVGFADPLFIMYSSGTTGLPKCMVHSVGGTLLQHLKEHRLHGDLGPGDRIFYFTTCGWMMWNWLVSALASRATVMLYDGHPLQPATTLWDYAAAERFTTLGTSARWLAACQKEGLVPRASHDLGALREILSTGSPLAPATFDWVYRDVKADVRLSSISGGTDIISCFALGSPELPVRRGELQTRGLGMDVAVFDDAGRPTVGRKGELVCTAPFPSMPTGFWNDPDGARYRAAYFARFPGAWCHGDWAELTASGGMVIHGRSDTVLNPGGVRIGTAEITRIVDRHPAVAESLVVGQERGDDVRVILFVVLRPGAVLDAALEAELKARIRAEASPRHVPARIVAAPAVPRTISGKSVELAVRETLHGRPVTNTAALANPEALEFFRQAAADLAD
ncbi:MAG TPA: acetoacetate--CoA ligase [Candidatus Krumholzibacteria bacterium]|nr:acetoacetate--CoA ligase [Candidatus Krumholzibacteria bacterium]